MAIRRGAEGRSTEVTLEIDSFDYTVSTPYVGQLRLAGRWRGRRRQPLGSISLQVTGPTGYASFADSSEDAQQPVATRRGTPWKAVFMVPVEHLDDGAEFVLRTDGEVAIALPTPTEPENAPAESGGGDTLAVEAAEAERRMRIEARRALAQARATIEEHAHENADLQERLKTTRLRAEEARSDLEAARAEAAAARSELGERSGLVLAAERRASDALEALAVARQTHAEEVAVHEGTTADLRSRLDELQRELAEAAGERTRSEREAEAITRERDALQAELSAQESQTLQELSSARSAWEEQTRASASRVEQLEGFAKELGAKLAGESRRRSALESEVEALRTGELSAAVEELARVRGSLEASEAERAEAAALAKEREAAVKVLRAALETSEADAAERMEALTRSADAYANSLRADVRKTVEEAEARVAAAWSQADAAIARERARADAEVAAAAEHAREAESRIAEVTDAIAAHLVGNGEVPVDGEEGSSARGLERADAQHRLLEVEARRERAEREGDADALQAADAERARLRTVIALGAVEPEPEPDPDAHLAAQLAELEDELDRTRAELAHAVRHAGVDGLDGAVPGPAQATNGAAGLPAGPPGDREGELARVEARMQAIRRELGGAQG